MLVLAKHFDLVCCDDLSCMQPVIIKVQRPTWHDLELYCNKKSKYSKTQYYSFHCSVIMKCWGVLGGLIIWIYFWVKQSRLFQISLSFYEFSAANTEDFSRVLSGPSLQGFCYWPSLSLFLSLEGKISY